MLLKQIQIYQTYPTSQENIKDILTKTEFNVFAFLSDVSRYCKTIYMTVETIAERVGCCKKTVSRATDKLNRLGIIRKYRKQRGVYEKCSYKVLVRITNTLKNGYRKFTEINLKATYSDKQSNDNITNRNGQSSTENVPVVNSSSSLLSSLKDNLFKRNIITSFSNTISKQEGAIISLCNNIGRFFHRDELIYSMGKEVSEGEEKKNQDPAKKEQGMNRDDNILITPGIKKATEMLDLAIFGQCTLRAFPDEAIEYGLEKLSFVPTNKSKVQFVIDTAKQYCSDKRINVNWKRSFDLKESYGLPSAGGDYTNKTEASKKMQGKPNKSNPMSHDHVPREVRDLCHKMEIATQEKLRLAEKKRKIAYVTPLREIKIWEDWLHSENYTICKHKLGYSDSALVAPSVIDIIKNKRVCQEEINRLFQYYPFMAEVCENHGTNLQILNIVEDLTEKMTTFEDQTSLPF